MPCSSCLPACLLACSDSTTLVCAKTHSSVPRRCCCFVAPCQRNTTTTTTFPAARLSRLPPLEIVAGLVTARTRARARAWGFHLLQVVIHSPIFSHSQIFVGSPTRHALTSQYTSQYSQKFTLASYLEAPMHSAYLQILPVGFDASLDCCILNNATATMYI